MNKIYVGNLPSNTTDKDLEAAFQGFGEIKEIILIRDRDTNELRGFGFITFISKTSAQSALEMDGKEFLGKAIKVSMARENNRRTGSGGGSGDRGGRGGFGGGHSSGGDRGGRGGRGDRW